jgi:NAD-dependent DNA ligase
MRKYILTVPKDDHGQPRPLFKFNFENNVSKAIDQLSGICSGILADGAVTDTEAQFFTDYVRKFAAYEPIWPFTEILTRVERVFADGVCDDQEREELKHAMEALCGHVESASASETYSSALPLNSPLPDPIVFQKHTFVITGRFAYGTRQKVFDTISALGGFADDSMPTRETNYLVIGIFASRDWANTNYGRKIERAVELRESNSGISIIPEEHWKRFVSRGS